MMRPWTSISELSFLCQTELESIGQSRVPLVGGATYLVGQMEWVGDEPISLSVILRPICAHVVAEYPQALVQRQRDKGASG